MMQARKTLEDYDARKGVPNLKVHGILLNAFNRASIRYLRHAAPKS
jgi:hypothetical protein